MFYATQDSDGIEIREDAEIRAFDTADEAKAWLLSCYDPDDVDFDSAVVSAGEFSDCWFKLWSRPDDDELARYAAPFGVDGLSVKNPGQHPGGKRWWVTPFADVLVISKISDLADEDDEAEGDDGEGDKAEFEAAIRAIVAWDGEDTVHLEGLVDDAEDIAHRIGSDDDGELTDEYHELADRIHVATGEGEGYPNFPEWPTLMAAGRDGLVLVISEGDGREGRMSVYTEDNPDFEEDDEADAA